MSRPRIAVVTSLFPLRAEPYRGKPIYETVRRLTEWAEIEAFCPISVYPPGLRPRTYQLRRADKDYSPPDVRTHYCNYWTAPLIGRIWNGHNAARAILPPLVRFQPDLILNYWVYPDGFAAAHAAGKLRLPVITGARGSDLLVIPGAATRCMIARTLERSDAVLAVSSELCRRAVELGASPDHVHLVSNGCDTSIFKPQERAEARQALNLPPDAQVILYVGHLIPAKGLSELAAAAAALPGVILVCVGEGVLHQALAARGIRVPGSATAREIALWMVASNVFCLPSYSEGCPNVVLEALACGRPVVATTVGAIPDLISPDCGILVPPRDATSLTAALKSALTRAWSPEIIAAAHQRTWRDTALDTFAVCRGLLCL